MTITVALHVIILLLLFYVGMSYLDPPIENGIAVNFGTSDTGSGEVQPKEKIKSEPIKTNPETNVSSNTNIDEAVVEEKVVTQNNEDAPIVKKEEKKTSVDKNEKNEIKKEPEPEPDKSTKDAISNLINGPKRDGKKEGGEGDDLNSGDKGNLDGDPNALNYYGVGKGIDGDGNYLLGGRKALNKEKYLQDCNEAGTVVVSIEVDRNGKVINARPGVKGTTNNSPCLLEPAKKAALATRFNQDDNAPSRQIGKIIYRFSLSD